MLGATCRAVVKSAARGCLCCSPISLNHGWREVVTVTPVSPGWHPVPRSRENNSDTRYQVERLGWLGHLPACRNDRWRPHVHHPRCYRSAHTGYPDQPSEDHLPMPRITPLACCPFLPPLRVCFCAGLLHYCGLVGGIVVVRTRAPVCTHARTAQDITHTSLISALLNWATGQLGMSQPVAR